jgi:hypothetical protein
VRDRIIEARETTALLPYVAGAAGRSGWWPETPSDYGNSRTFRRRATAAEIARMEEVMGWIAALPEEADRKLLRDYAWLKTSPHARIGIWCEKNGWPERIFRRRVDLLCQRIANDLNRNTRLRLDAADCAVSEMSAEVIPEALPRKSAPFERAEDAKPADLPEHPDRGATIRRIQRWAAERSRRERSAQVDRC